MRGAGLGDPPGLRAAPCPAVPADPLLNAPLVSPQHGGPPARHTMPAKAALLLALLAALLGGCRAVEPAQGWGGRAEPGAGSAMAAPPTAALLPKAPPAELARGSFWDYLSQLTSDKDSLEPGQSKLGRDSM